MYNPRKTEEYVSNDNGAPKLTLPSLIYFAGHDTLCLLGGFYVPSLCQ